MTASCCCGAASITVNGHPTLNAICHCDDCKRRTGSVFGWNAYFKLSQIESQRGDTLTYSPEIDPEQVRYSCKLCKSTLFWTTPFRPDEIGVAGGSFVDPSLPQPLHSARHKNRCTWVSFPSDMEPWP